MQLILDTESTVDIKTKMSLNEENLEKCVSDIMPDIKNDGIANGDVTNGNKETVELKENVDVDKIEQIKESVKEINSIETVDHKTTVTKNADIESNHVELQTSQDSESKDNFDNETAVCKNVDSKSNHADFQTSDIPNGENESVVNSESTEQSPDLVESIENENTTNVENSINNESAMQPTSNATLPVAVSNNDESESNTFQSTTESANIEAIHDNAVKSCNESDANLTESVEKENDETAVNSTNQANISNSCDLNKDLNEINEENDTEMTPPVAIMEELHNDTAKNVDATIAETEVEENAPDSESKETMETDSTEINISDENNDIKSLDIKPDNTPNDSDLRKTRKEEISATDAVVTEDLNTDKVTKMDVDETENPSHELETKEDNITTAENSTTTENSTESIESNNSEYIETDDTKTDTTLGHDRKGSKDIVSLDEDKEKLIVNPEKSEFSQIVVDDDKRIINCDDDTETEKSTIGDPKTIDEIIDLDETMSKETTDSKLPSEENKKQEETDKGSVESKPMEPILKLSNTLDILSDDEEEQVKLPTNDNKCINIEDDDDVMLIDDDTCGNESKPEPNKESVAEKDSKPKSPIDKSVKINEDNGTSEEVDEVPKKDIVVVDKEEKEPTPTPVISEKVEENQFEIEKQKPLLPENFLKTCKKNLADMTREELEEFCILKIVESVLDRSSLSEIKNKLKVLTQNIDDYKKKTLMLSKQNRDLQVVLKSIQDDVKKSNEAPIVPLKITRSVGMQVLMADKPDKRRRGIGFAPPNKQMRTPTMQNPRPQKPPTQQIPVPRLVPANNTAIKSPNAQVNAAKVTSPLPNGVKSASPVQKGEKRSHNRMQSVTVDLTDDEPPPKVVNRTQNPVPPVRLVPSQNLLAAPRTPGTNSPRKVYIPISGPQAQNVRPGQTIMLKTVPSTNQRTRVPPPHMVRMPQSIRVSRPQGLRHPAPLPECMKQYQPPNWKALPPAPDLKLAKVENGIVISWKIEGYQEDSYEEIASYQLYAYQETTSPPNTTLWKKIGDVKALPLPMACTLTQFMAGYKYYFAVRAVDIRSRLGPFSLPGSILLLNKM